MTQGMLWQNAPPGVAAYWFEIPPPCPSCGGQETTWHAMWHQHGYAPPQAPFGRRPDTSSCIVTDLRAQQAYAATLPPIESSTP